MSTYVNNLRFIQPVENQAIITDSGALLYTAPANTFARVQVHVNLGNDVLPIFFDTAVEIKVNGQTIFAADDGPYFQIFTNLKIIPLGTVEMFTDGDASVFCSVTGASFSTEIEY